MDQQTNQPSSPPENRMPTASPAKKRGSGRRTLAILVLGWVGIALTIAFIRGLLAHPAGLILMGLMLAIGWTTVTLIDMFWENETGSGKRP